MLAIVIGLDHWHRYLYGHKILVYTDNKPDSTIRTQSKPDRLTRWINYLEEFDLTIKWKPGKDQVVPDALSRITAESLVFNIDTGSIGSLQERDSELGPYINYLKNKNLPEDTKRHKEIVAIASKLVLNVGRLFYSEVKYSHKKGDRTVVRLAIPKCLRHQLMESCHDDPLAGHLGYDQTLGRISSRSS